MYLIAMKEVPAVGALNLTVIVPPLCVIVGAKPAKLTPESEILKSSNPMPARKPWLHPLKRLQLLSGAWSLP